MRCVCNGLRFQLYKVAVQKQNGASWFVLRRYKEFYDLYQTVSCFLKLGFVPDSFRDIIIVCDLLLTV